MKPPRLSRVLNANGVTTPNEIGSQVDFNQDSFSQFPAYKILQHDQPWFRATWENEVHAAERNYRDFDFSPLIPETEEDMPQLLDIASVILRDPFDDRNFSRVRELARAHGRDRSKLVHFTLQHLICEYQILRTVILDTLEKANCLQTQTLERIERLIDESMSQATIVFAEIVQERLLTTQSDLANNLKQVDALKNRYETALHATGDVIWDLDLQTGTMITNEAIQTTLGHKQSTIQQTAQWWLDHIHPDDLPRVKESMESLFNGSADHWFMEYRFRRGDETYADISSKAYIHRDSRNIPISFMGAMQDISDRKHLERELKSQNEKLESGIRERTAFLNSILDNLHDGIAACDLSGRVTTTNSALINILGGSDAILPAPTPLALSKAAIFTEDGSRLIRPEETGLYRALNGEVVRNHKTLARLPDGSERHLESDAQPLIGGEGRAIGSVVIVHDRTREVQAALEFQRLSEQIQYVKRSADLLEKTNVELESFAAVAAHDLKSPLNSISQFAEILSEDYKGKVGEEADEIFDYIQSASLRMRTLIDSLLNYAKSGAGLEISKDVDANSICQSAVSNLSSTIRSNQAKVVCQNLPSLRADPNRLLQVLQNLIANGVKFGREHVPVEIDIQAIDEGRDWRFEVRDNGVGISSKDASSVFDFFKRLSTERPREGSGIGLAVCKRIVELHGGSIWIEPVAEGGTKVCFTLPKSDPEIPKNDSERPMTCNGEQKAGL